MGLLHAHIRDESDTDEGHLMTETTEQKMTGEEQHEFTDRILYQYAESNYNQNIVVDHVDYEGFIAVTYSADQYRSPYRTVTVRWCELDRCVPIQQTWMAVNQ